MIVIRLHDGIIDCRILDPDPTDYIIVGIVIVPYLVHVNPQLIGREYEFLLNRCCLRLCRRDPNIAFAVHDGRRVDYLSGCRLSGHGKLHCKVQQP